MAAVDSIRVSIECSRDWGAQRLQEQPTEWPEFRKDFIDKYQKKLNLPSIIRGTRISQQFRALCKETPWPKGQMDDAWLKRAVMSREQLSRVWKSFRDGLKSQQQRKGFSQAFIDVDFAALSAADRPESLMAIEEEKQFVLERLEQKKLMKARDSTS
jgi:hypothetical protein